MFSYSVKWFLTHQRVYLEWSGVCWNSKVLKLKLADEMLRVVTDLLMLGTDHSAEDYSRSSLKGGRLFG
jgi:hypothetical protein